MLNLSPLLSFVGRTLTLRTNEPHVSVLGVPEAAKAAVLAALAAQHHAPLVVVVARPDRAVTLADELGGWLGDERAVAIFPEQDIVAYHRVARDARASEQRLETLRALHSDAPPAVVIVSGLGLAQTTIAPDTLSGATELVSVGDELPLEPFLRRLQERGYELGPLVEEPGQASRRGGIVDVFPPAAEFPLRVELLGDRVESLRAFDPATQRSRELLAGAEVGPVGETLIVGPRLAQLRESLDFSELPPDLALELQDSLINTSDDPAAASAGLWLPFLASSTLLDHIPPASPLVVDEPAELRQVLAELDGQAEETRAAMETSHQIPRGLPLPHVSQPTLMAAIDARKQIELSRWATPETAAASVPPFSAAATFGGRLRQLSLEVIARMRAGWRVVVVSQQAPRLAELFASEGLDPAAPLDRLPPEGSLRLLNGSLPHGWSLQTPDGNLLLLTDNEIFGFTKQRRGPVTRPTGREAFLSDLNPGDLVVHVEHGIARFAGLVNRRVEGVDREYLELRYAENDRLFVPTDHIDRVSRYIGPGEHAPALTRLSSQDWTRAKERVRRAVSELAQELLSVYAAREALPGHAFSPDSPWQQELEAAFPYVETADQLRALAEIKRDMEAARPMDRVMVGDVGYGKTELALRAAFKAVMDGKQVAVLVPTTVLAQQHLHTFAERLSGFPTRVDVLSRFRNDREQRQVLEGLADGSVDIVIGTHRLLQRDVHFKDLGLLIIDEEQRFGVAHKERFRRLRQQVDVLTLSATPIPRTLHMALSGIRDMSTVQTAPEERLPISTYVAEWDDRLVRDAALRELDRGGQIYLVHNRVHNIDQIAARLRKIVPEVTVAVGHGQMHEDQLEQVMIEFARGEHDVLACTTIIESGLDIPNVNTIIINQADRLGLAQLYQLRGRVGRGANRAYAYLLYDRDRVPTETAQKRLQTIFEASELGAGYQIALKDLEIRGAGNLLGAEQSGHIGAVGFDLYSRMLADAVTRLRAVRRGESPPPAATAPNPVTIDLPLAARIPESYVADLNLRLATYQRLAAVDTAQGADELLAELQDRFGPPPPPLQNLIFIVRLRALARAAGLVSILAEDSQVVLRSAGPIQNGPRQQAGSVAGVQIGTAQVRIVRRGDQQEWMQRVGSVVDALAAG